MIGQCLLLSTLAKIGGQDQLLVQTRTKLAGVDPENGQELWTQEIEAFRGMNILTPWCLTSGCSRRRMAARPTCSN